jgi:hypothetical protein
MLDAFVDAGLEFIDTADAYSSWVPGREGGESETLIGKWLRRSGKREKGVIATTLEPECNASLKPFVHGAAAGLAARGAKMDGVGVSEALALIEIELANGRRRGFERGQAFLAGVADLPDGSRPAAKTIDTVAGPAFTCYHPRSN